MFRTGMTALACTVALGAAPLSQAASVYSTTLKPLNNSGVGGVVTVTIDGNNLSTQLAIVGLEANQPHVAHIHGRFNEAGDPIDSFSPTAAADTDGDGFVELLEALGNYGPIIVPFGPFTVDDAPLNTTINNDLDSDDTFAADFGVGDLTPLDLREFVIHGLTVPAGVGDGTAGEINGNGGYIAVLPVATGEFVLIASDDDDGNGGPNPIPTPSAAAAGLALMGFLAGRRRRATEA